VGIRAAGRVRPLARSPAPCNNLPFALAVVAAAVLVGTLYISYAIELEIIAYVLLVIAAVLNQNVFLTRLNVTVRQQASEIDCVEQEPRAQGRAPGP
jgi:small-conductance mechanosensitive channel